MISEPYRLVIVENYQPSNLGSNPTPPNAQSSQDVATHSPDHESDDSQPATLNAPEHSLSTSQTQTAPPMDDQDLSQSWAIIPIERPTLDTLSEIVRLARAEKERSDQERPSSLLSALTTPITAAYQTTTEALKNAATHPPVSDPDDSEDPLDHVENLIIDIETLSQRLETDQKHPPLIYALRTDDKTEAAPTSKKLLKYVQSTLDNTIAHNMPKLLARGLPAIKKQLEDANAQINEKRERHGLIRQRDDHHRELNAVLAQEQRRKFVCLRIMAMITTRYEHCRSIEHAICAAEHALATLPKRSSQPLAQKSDLNDSSAISQLIASQMAEARDALYRLITSLIQSFHARINKIYSSHPAVENEPTPHRAAIEAEAAFKSTRVWRFIDWYPWGKPFIIPINAHRSAWRRMGNTDDVTTIRFDQVREDIYNGATLTHSILASEPNIGTAKFPPVTDENTGHYTAPSNLTTIRCIARYIEAQGFEGNDCPKRFPATATITKRDDNTFIVSDPDRNLYSFLASAPTAYAPFLNLSEQQTTRYQQHPNIGRMVVTDYSNLLPGQTNHIAFEPRIDENGKSILIVQFSKQDDVSVSPHDQNTLIEMIDQAKHRLDGEADESHPADAPLEAIDFSAMQETQIKAYISNMTIYLEEQTALLKADRRQFLSATEAPFLKWDKHYTKPSPSYLA